MGKSRKNEREITSRGAYATLADFKRIFSEDVNSLFLLSFLLTGTPDKAEECFVEGIGESTKGNYVFKEWARSWARRTIIQSSIRLIAPMFDSTTVSRACRCRTRHGQNSSNSTCGGPCDSRARTPRAVRFRHLGSRTLF